MDFQKLDQDGLTVLEEWFKDAEVLNRLNGRVPLLQWYNYVEQSPDYFAWMVFENGVSIGQITVELYEDQTAAIDILTNPQLRYKGYGTKMLQTLLKRSELSSTQMIKVGIETDNHASINCFKKVGFVEHGLDKDGLLELTYYLNFRRD
ncbi:GNAT family N-acetyltransferase [Paenibacillus sp. EC2-1]|uniref:GNAT family N-acetyltransferase n=1 Tax=Paenibacillus sp. EC2-1 TaxID=3388665 RepID=UPI003BEEB490